MEGRAAEGILYLFPYHGVAKNNNKSQRVGSGRAASLGSTSGLRLVALKFRGGHPVKYILAYPAKMRLRCDDHAADPGS